MGWSEFFRSIQRDEASDSVSRLMRGLLACAESPYAWGVRLRNAYYNRYRPQAEPGWAPVISVGNLTVGGTGKSPLVRWIANWCSVHGCRVAVLSRGYGRLADGQNDEAREMRALLPSARLYLDPDRRRSAASVTRDRAADVILLDDGFQHRRMPRDLDIVTIDATDPFGGGRLLPRGRLREPLDSLRRADLAILTRCDAIAPSRCGEILDRVRAAAPQLPVVTSRMLPVGFWTEDGRLLPIESLRGADVVLFSAIGNPSAFRAQAESLGLQVRAEVVFPDHFPFDSPSELEDRIGRLPVMSGGAGLPHALICTFKDFVKLPVFRIQGVPIHALRVELDFLSRAEELERRLRELTQHRRSPKVAD